MKQSVISEMRLTNRTCKLCIGNASQPHLSTLCHFFFLFLLFSSENYFTLSFVCTTKVTTVKAHTKTWKHLIQVSVKAKQK